jgi:heparan-alpha-glucosaminide N-acetyltransferase
MGVFCEAQRSGIRTMNTDGQRVAAPQSQRVVSVDILRGITMLVMIFVNDVAGVKGLPWWTYHLPAHVNGMTYVDVVFPVFLFIVGISIPLAVRRRLEKDSSQVRLWGHILARAVSLAALGIIIANSGRVDPELTGIHEGLWGALAFAGAVLFWNVYPADSRRRALFASLKWAGLLILVVLVAIFRRRTPDGGSAWLDFSYWEILGLIGCAYLSACLLYVPARKSKWAPLLFVVLLTAMNVLGKLGWLGLLRHLPLYAWPFGTGALASIVMAGIVASIIFLDPAFAPSFREKAWWALGYAAVLFTAGWLLTSFGISKIRATPTWCLYCSGISTMILLAIYWLADVKGHSGWAAFVKPAGSNTLLTYLLPDIFYAATGLYYVGGMLGRGLPGVLKSAVFTAAMLGCAAVLTRWKIRLQL